LGTAYRPVAHLSLRRRMPPPSSLPRIMNRGRREAFTTVIGYVEEAMTQPHDKGRDDRCRLQPAL
jgi:hypothetical protein